MAAAVQNTLRGTSAEPVISLFTGIAAIHRGCIRVSKCQKTSGKLVNPGYLIRCGGFLSCGFCREKHEVLFVSKVVKHRRV